MRYLERLQRYFSNRYYLVLLALSENRPVFRINVETEAANSEIAVSDIVWVPAARN